MSEQARLVLELIGRAERPGRPLPVDVNSQVSCLNALPLAKIEYRLARERLALARAANEVFQAYVAYGELLP